MSKINILPADHKAMVDAVDGVTRLTKFVYVLDINHNILMQHAFGNNNGWLDCITIDDEGEIFVGGNWEEDFEEDIIIAAAIKYDLRHSLCSEEIVEEQKADVEIDELDLLDEDARKVRAEICDSLDSIKNKCQEIEADLNKFRKYAIQINERESFDKMFTTNRIVRDTAIWQAENY